MSTTLVAELEKYCVFRQSDVLFALPARCVVEVTPNPVMVPVPSADRVLAGIAHLRNEFLAVVDLGALVDGGETADQSDKQLLVVKGAHGSWGLYVDRVVGLESLEVSNSQDVRDEDDWAAAMIGSATLRNEVTRILNPSSLYRLAEGVLTKAWTQPDRETSPAEQAQLDATPAAAVANIPGAESGTSSVAACGRLSNGEKTK